MSVFVQKSRFQRIVTNPRFMEFRPREACPINVRKGKEGRNGCVTAGIPLPYGLRPSIRAIKMEVDSINTLIKGDCTC